MMNLFAPSLLMVSAGVAQLAVLRSVFSCKFQPVEGKGHCTTTVLVMVGKILSSGAPGVCTTESKLQNPPMTEYWPLVIGPLASCWPMVPLTKYWPFALVPPPPAILDQLME